jgi:hypothetical protein
MAVAVMEAYHKLRSHVDSLDMDQISFDQLAAFMQEKATLKLAMDFFNAAKSFQVVSKVPPTRVFLAGFMVAKFPEDVLEIKTEDKSEQDELCLNAATNMVRKFSVPQEEKSDEIKIEEILSAIHEFTETFSRWKEHDLRRQINQLSGLYLQWKMAIEFVEKSQPTAKKPELLQDMLESLKMNQGIVVEQLCRLGGKRVVEELEAKAIEVLDLDKIIQEAGAEQYWKNFEHELSSTPPQFHRVILLLSEIRERLLKLVPNSTELQQRIQESIDVDFIQELITRNAFDGMMFVQVFENIWSTIRSMQAEADDEKWMVWKDETFAALVNEEEATWAKILPNIFNKFLIQLDRIEEQVEIFKQLSADSQGTKTA